MEFDWNDVFTTTKEVLSDIDKINYLNSMFPPDPDVESLSYGEVKKGFQKLMEVKDKDARTEEDILKLTDELDITKEMALLEEWADRTRSSTTLDHLKEL